VVRKYAEPHCPIFERDGIGIDEKFRKFGRIAKFVQKTMQQKRPPHPNLALLSYTVETPATAHTCGTKTGLREYRTWRTRTA
jgi:hypothetical protein